MTHGGSKPALLRLRNCLEHLLCAGHCYWLDLVSTAPALSTPGYTAGAGAQLPTVEAGAAGQPCPVWMPSSRPGLFVQMLSARKPTQQAQVGQLTVP